MAATDCGETICICLGHGITVLICTMFPRGPCSVRLSAAVSSWVRLSWTIMIGVITKRFTKSLPMYARTLARACSHCPLRFGSQAQLNPRRYFDPRLASARMGKAQRVHVKRKAARRVMDRDSGIRVGTAWRPLPTPWAVPEPERAFQLLAPPAKLVAAAHPAGRADALLRKHAGRPRSRHPAHRRLHRRAARRRPAAPHAGAFIGRLHARPRPAVRRPPGARNPRRSLWPAAERHRRPQGPQRKGGWA